MPSGRRLLPRALLSFGVLAVLLLLAEWALGWSGMVGDPREFVLRRMTQAVEQDAWGRYVTHPRRGYTTAPGFRWSPTHLGRDATGTWPYRGRPPVPRPPDAEGRTLRVALIGDSCVYGASLDACDTLGWKLQQALDAAGLPSDRLMVCSWGVPGYTTVQMFDLCEEALRDFAPDAVVLYPAAWNDQAPALRRPDAELLSELTDPSAVDWLRLHTRLGAALLHVAERLPAAEVVAAWNAGRAPFGERVPEDELPARLDALVALARSGPDGAEGSAPRAVCLLAPPHPKATLAEHPRTGRDAVAVLAAAARAGLPAVDGQAVLAEAGLDEAHAFLDYVHPSPEGMATLAEALARRLLPALQSIARARPGLGLADGDPNTTHGEPGDDAPGVIAWSESPLPVLGDARIRLQLTGWARGDPLPAIVAGGAPLLDVVAEADDSLSGLVIANGAGRHDLLVQTARGCALRRQALTLEDPTLELHPLADGGAMLLVTSRAGDRVRLVETSGTPGPVRWTARGAMYPTVPPGPLALARPPPGDLACDATGQVALRLPTRPDVLSVQALVAPAGESLQTSLAARWCRPVTLSAARGER